MVFIKIKEKLNLSLGPDVQMNPRLIAPEAKIHPLDHQTDQMFESIEKKK
jgi:hypothetical protein